MKKLKNISVVAFFLACLSAGAMEVEKDGVSLNGGQTLVVELAKVSQGTLISFEDQEGEILFKDNLLMNGDYSRTFYLEMIPNGIYFLKVDKKFATRVWKISKSSEGIDILGNSSILSFKPQFRLQEKLVKVFMSNPAKNSVDLMVEDRNGELLVNLRDSKDVFSKTLDFSKLPAGEYFVTVLKGNEKFKEKVVIN
ncbi:T9SS type A sorting domain-containing protein [Salinimicrobium terrae]|uniref:T9SS type A sorting domain-containing protein n=1 Tax=Salinimicrobium terrae TaxID=470866 RepID=UPI000414473A|nr:T9SS type A sorting domain-containing protein [Salinimicrobium terrae]